MPILTDIAQAAVRSNVRTLYGKVLTRPALKVSDGVNAIYACDVEVGAYDPTGKIDQYKDYLTHLPNVDGPDDDDDPDHPEWELGDELVYNSILRNVTIARNSGDLIYADVGSPVIVSRSASGQWEITGFAIEQPGTYTLVAVNLDDMTLGPIRDYSIDGRLLTLGELGTYRPFGQLPLGASGIFVGGRLRQIV